MARLVEKSEQRAHAAPPALDPLRSTNASIERLAQIVTYIAQLPPPQINIPPPPEPLAHPARPKRVEATITRDSAGKMDKVVLTPIY